MKKLLSLILSAVILVSAAVIFTVPTSAAESNKLIIMDEDRTLAEVEVGNEFIYRVGLYTGSYSIINGQANVKYDSDYVQVVEYGPVNSKGKIIMDAYCFPDKIRNSNLVTNYFDADNNIYYNFSKFGGIEAFDSVDDHYFKIRFKAIAPGVVEIKHYMTRMTHHTDDNKDVMLFNKGKANSRLDPVPYSISSAEPATAYIGDADGDYALTIMDATFIQRATAGVDCSYKLTNADVNQDGDVNLKDALIIERYKAGLSVSAAIDEWIFDSEQ